MNGQAPNYTLISDLSGAGPGPQGGVGPQQGGMDRFETLKYYMDTHGRGRKNHRADDDDSDDNDDADDPDGDDDAGSPMKIQSLIHIYGILIIILILILNKNKE